MSEQKENLFPTMGEIATRTDALRDVEDNDARLDDRQGALVDQEEGEERGMQEMDSLCMRCHDQVSSLAWQTCLSELIRAGGDTAAPDDNPVLQGNRGLFVPVRSLRAQRH